MTLQTKILNGRLAWMLALSLSAIAAGPGATQAQRDNKWTDEEFEDWVFDDGNAAATRKRLEALLNMRMEEIDRICQITKEQKKKLQLMGAGEIKGVFDMYETAKRRFNRLGNDRTRLVEVIPFTRPIALAQMNMFQEGSLLAKSLRHTLDDSQLAQYEVAARERLEFHHKAQIELAVRTLEESMSLRDAQRQELIALLTKEIKPTKISDSYYLYIIMYKVSLMMDDKIKPVLTDIQWKDMNRKLDRYRAIVANLRQHGFMPDDDDVDANTAKEAPRK